MKSDHEVEGGIYPDEACVDGRDSRTRSSVEQLYQKRILYRCTSGYHSFSPIAAPAPLPDSGQRPSAAGPVAAAEPVEADVEVAEPVEA
jgi:hypothetical protein